jgi:hypothetical protein
MHLDRQSLDARMYVYLYVIHSCVCVSVHNTLTQHTHTHTHGMPSVLYQHAALWAQKCDSTHAQTHADCQWQSSISHSLAGSNLNNEKFVHIILIIIEVSFKFFNGFPVANWY